MLKAKTNMGAEVRATVIRADGTIEELGVISTVKTKPTPLWKRIINKLLKGR